MKNHIYIGIYLLVSLLLLCALPVMAFFSSINIEIIRTLIFVGASGGIGGTLYSIRGFYKNLGGNTFEVRWNWWYIFRPIISVVLGVFTYFLIVGGLMSISNTTDVTLSKGIMFYCGVSFLACFSFTRFAERLDNISDILFAKKNQEQSNE